MMQLVGQMLGTTIRLQYREIAVRAGPVSETGSCFDIEAVLSDVLFPRRKAIADMRELISCG